MHMDLAPGDLANRIITVGSVSRLQKIARFLDDPMAAKTVTSSRGFTTVTGTYDGVLVSIVAIGMGPSMMDFFVRESCAILSGRSAIVRFGTCGGISEESLPGNIVLASEGSGYISRNMDAFAGNYDSDSVQQVPETGCYNFSHVAPSCSVLSALVHRELCKTVGQDQVIRGVNVTADSFYSAQGRSDSNFDDGNQSIIGSLREHYPGARSLEMESFMLLHLAKCSKKPIAATAAAIVLANRLSAKVIDEAAVSALEEQGGTAILKALVAFDLDH